MKSAVLTAMLMSIVSAQALAFPLSSEKEISQGFLATDGINFEATVALSNCSASLVRYETSLDSDFALVLTNGHCVGRKMIPPGKAIVGRKEKLNADVLDRDANSLGQIHLNKLIYGTMTKTDFALYQSNITYAEVRKTFAVEPLTLSSEEVEIGAEVEVISSYWRRGYRCRIEALIHTLKEGNWTFRESLRYSRPGCEVIGGTSGSPVLLKGSRTVVAINNTGNLKGGRCTEGNPCEVDEDGQITAIKGHSYAQQTNWIYTCIDETRKLNLNLPGCLLPK